MKRSQEDAEIPHEERSPSDSPAPSLLSNPAKYAQVDTAGENPVGHESVMCCYLPPHPYGLSFPSYESYEVHYQQYHVHRCTECHKNFPSDHYLNLHIAENHDPLNAAKRDKGDKTYGCFVESCEKLCSTPQSRRMHLMSKHSFPKFYDFFIVNDGIDRRNSMLKPSYRRRNSTAAARSGPRMSSETVQETGAETDLRKPRGSSTSAIAQDSAQRPPENAVEGIANAMSALSFVPPSVKFGKGRAGFAKREQSAN